jgi:LysR family glycine cleavage system transcriptional activator
VPSFAARWLLPRIRNFLAAYPDVDLDVRSNIINIDFQRDDSDIAIRYGHGNWLGVTAEHLLDDWFFPVCSPNIANGIPARPEDLANYTLLRSEDEPWKPWFEAAGLDWPEPTRGPIFNDSGNALQAAAAGHGIALARSSLLAHDVRNGILVRLFDVVVPAPKKFWLVYPPRTANTPKLALFRQWLHDEIEAERRSDAPTTRRKAPQA